MNRAHVTAATQLALLLAAACTAPSAVDSASWRSRGPGDPIALDQALPGDLILTEIHYDPSGSDLAFDREWFEVLNLSSDHLDLDGLVVTTTADSFVVSGSLVIAPGGYLIFAESMDPTVNGGLSPPPDYAIGITTLPLYNEGDTLSLTFDGVTLDAVTWDPAVWPSLEGRSMSLDPSALDAVANDDPANWCNSWLTQFGDVGDYGTPRGTNDRCDIKDLDGDGFIDQAYGGDDCDDTNDEIYPGAPEIPGDGVDQSCDGLDAEFGIADLAPGDLVITEIHNNPSPPPNELDSRWFEIQNVSAQAFDLVGLYVHRDSTVADCDADPQVECFTIDRSLVIQPGGRLVLARRADPALNGGITPDFAWGFGWWPRIEDDEITLLAGTTIIDRVAYDQTFAAFPGASWMLEPTLTDAASNDDMANWCDAYSPFGDGDLGTPGQPNDICIGRDVDQDGFVDADWGGDDCDDRDPLVRPSAFDLPDSGVDEDCDGKDADFGVGDLATGDLVITEIHNNPTTGSAAKWFEVYNGSGLQVDLIGLDAINGADRPCTSVVDPKYCFTVDRFVVLDPGEYALFGRNDDPAQNGGITPDATWASGWDPSSFADTIALYAGPTRIDVVVYSGFNDFPGASWMLEPTLTDAASNDALGNWCDAYSPFGDGDLGTPGQPNDPCVGRDADEDGFADAAWGGDDCDDRDPTINPGATEIPFNGVDEDCDGADTEVSLHDLLPGDLIVSEIMHRPLRLDDLGEDPPLTETAWEWLEVHNRTDEAVDLNGLLLSSAQQSDRAVAGPVYLFAGEYVVLGREIDPQDNGGAPVDAAYGGFFLPNTETSLRIASPPPSETVLDEVPYAQPTSGFPSVRGSSIQLDPAAVDAGASGQGASWCPSMDAYGEGLYGTPGAPNRSCSFTLDFDFDYAHDTDPTQDFTGSTSFSFLPSPDRTAHPATFTTGNFGDGVATFTSGSSGQAISWIYDNTGVVYTGARGFGGGCFSGTIGGATGPFSGTWVGCLVD